jgi:hypothetical protein
LALIACWDLKMGGMTTAKTKGHEQSRRVFDDELSIAQKSDRGIWYKHEQESKLT